MRVAAEALDDEGQRHALGNMICGALSPFLIGGRPVLPPVTVTLMRRGSVIGGVMRDAHISASLALFARCPCVSSVAPKRWRHAPRVLLLRAGKALDLVDHLAGGKGRRRWQRCAGVAGVCQAHDSDKFPEPLGTILDVQARGPSPAGMLLRVAH